MAEHDDLMDAARAQTGLDDFGGDSFREGLEILVHGLRHEAKLNAMGEEAMRGRIVGLLAQRLQIEDWFRRHPEMAEEPIEAPLIGLGLPRTGSTALSFLLAEDPATRSLRLWESAAPAPPPPRPPPGVFGAGGTPPPPPPRRRRPRPRSRARGPRGGGRRGGGFPRPAA